MGKLDSYARQNRVAKALREMGPHRENHFHFKYLSSEEIHKRMLQHITSKFIKKC